MADLPCDLCGQEPAGAMFTNLANGDTLAIGHACMLTFNLSSAAELAVGVPDDQRGQYAELVGKLAGAIGLGSMLMAEPEAPKRKPGRPRKQPLTEVDENPVTGDMEEHKLRVAGGLDEATP